MIIIRSLLIRLTSAFSLWQSRGFGQPVFVSPGAWHPFSVLLALSGGSARVGSLIAGSGAAMCLFWILHPGFRRSNRYWTALIAAVALAFTPYAFALAAFAIASSLLAVARYIAAASRLRLVIAAVFIGLGLLAASPLTLISILIVLIAGVLGFGRKHVASLLGALGALVAGALLAAPWWLPLLTLRGECAPAATELGAIEDHGPARSLDLRQPAEMTFGSGRLFQLRSAVILHDGSWVLGNPLIDYLGIQTIKGRVPVIPPGRHRGPEGDLQNERALPRFFLAGAYLIHAEPRDAISVVRRMTDFREVAVVDHVPSKVLRIGSGAFLPHSEGAFQHGAGGTVVFRHGQVGALDVDSQGWNLLVSSVPWWTGWRVYWNGERMPPVAVNGAFLGMFVPPGHGVAEVRYHPEVWDTAIRLAGLGLLFLVITCLWPWHVVAGSYAAPLTKAFHHASLSIVGAVQPALASVRPQVASLASAFVNPFETAHDGTKEAGSRATDEGRSRTLRIATLLLPIAYFVGLALWWTWPLPAHLSDHVVSSAWWYDGLLNTAQLETWSSNLLQRPGDLLEGYQFYPHHDVLSFTEQLPVLSLMARLLRSFGATPIGAANLVLLLGLALDGWCAFLLVRTITGSMAAALLAGTLLQATPYLVYEIGRVQLVWLCTFPLALACVHLLATSVRVRSAAIALALTLALAWGSCVYYAVLLTPLVVLVAFVYAASGLVVRRAVFLARTVGATALGIVALLPGLLAYRRVSATFGFGRSLDKIAPADLLAYLHLNPGPWAFWGGALANGTQAGESVLFPGVVLLGLTLLLAASVVVPAVLRSVLWLAGLVCGRRVWWHWHTWLALVWVAALISFFLLLDASTILLAVLITCLWPRPGGNVGPLTIAVRALSLVAIIAFALSLGRSVAIAGTVYTLPLRWLFDVAPGFHAIRLVSRWGALAIASASCAGAIFAAAAFARRRTLRVGLPLVLVLLAIVELRPHTQGLIPIRPLVEDRPGYRFLRDHPGGVLVSLPVRGAAGLRVDSVMEDAILTYGAACFHHHPTVNGMSGFDPPFYSQVVLPVLAGFPDGESLSLLDALGVRWVYLRGEQYDPKHFAELVAFARAHPERWRVVVHEREEILLELVTHGQATHGQAFPPKPTQAPTTAAAPLPEDCTVTASIGGGPARRFAGREPGRVWPDNAPQRGVETVEVTCRQPLAAAGFVFNLGGRFAGYPRGLVIERQRSDGEWVPVLVEKNAIDLDRLVLHPLADRVVKPFKRTRANAWRIRQTGTSVRDPWSVAGVEVLTP